MLVGFSAGRNINYLNCRVAEKEENWLPGLKIGEKAGNEWPRTEFVQTGKIFLARVPWRLVSNFQLFITFETAYVLGHFFSLYTLSLNKAIHKHEFL